MLARSAAGNTTLFAFDAARNCRSIRLVDALVLTLSGALRLTVGGRDVDTGPHTIVVMPANVAHAVHAMEASRTLLIMLREAA